MGLGGRAYEVHACGLAAGLGGRGPDRAGAEVVEVAVDGGQARLIAVVGGAPDHHIGADDASCVGGRQVTLAEVQHVRARGQCDIGAVVHREQGAVASRRGLDLGERAQLGLGLHRPEFGLARRPLVPELHDVYATG